MKFLLVLLLTLSSMCAYEIDTLLHDYEKESELSKKTKDESAGNIIIYTRDDLERMQVETLKDLLKSLRFFTYAENRIAQPDILNQDPIVYYSKSIRIYLNENELLSAITGSGLILFGDMEMDFINHIEIYEGFPSFNFGVEPATIVIRLYSKSAQHDEGGRVKTTIGSYGSNTQNVYYTNKENGFSYFAYANRTDSKKDSYEHNNETLRRDKKTNRFYGSLETENHRVELHAQQTSGDAFLGSLVGAVPKSTSTDSSFINLSTHSKFLDDSLTINLSYIDTQHDFSYRYDPATPVYIPIPIPPGFISVTSFDQTIKDEALTGTLKKVWDLDIHTISAGVQYRYKYFDLTDVEFNGVAQSIDQAYYKEEIYSIFLQDLIALNEKHLISLSLMSQTYQRGSDVDNQDTNQLRLGYIYSDKEWVVKTFISKQEFASEPYMTISPHYGNVKLKPETYSSILQEISYQTSQTTSKILLGYSINEDMAVLDKKFQIQNSDIDVTTRMAALEFTLGFNKKDKLELQASYLRMNSPYDNHNIEHYSYVIRVLNSISKFDIFNELIINHGYTNLETGYDYSAGVKYEINKDFHINLKGENIFNTALEWDYINAFPSDTVVVPIIERRFFLGMEYLF